MFGLCVGDETRRISPELRRRRIYMILDRIRRGCWCPAKKMSSSPLHFLSACPPSKYLSVSGLYRPLSYLMAAIICLFVRAGWLSICTTTDYMNVVVSMLSTWVHCCVRTSLEIDATQLTKCVNVAVVYCSNWHFLRYII